MSPRDRSDTQRNGSREGLPRDDEPIGVSRDLDGPRERRVLEREEFEPTPVAHGERVALRSEGHNL